MIIDSDKFAAYNAAEYGSYPKYDGEYYCLARVKDSKSANGSRSIPK